MNFPPDPRSYAAAGGSSLALLASVASAAGSALQQAPGGPALLEAVRQALERGRDADLLQGLVRAGSQAAYVLLEDTIDRALRLTEEAVGVQVFAFPLLLVTGGKASGRIPGTVPDVSALREILEVQGALGQARNVGLGNALASAEALEAVPPSRLYASGRGAGSAFADLGTPPADILLETEEERVHLRFLLGAAVTPRDAPDISETASDIGAWGMAWTRMLATQLAQPGLSLLPVPRPPLTLRRALGAGRFAWREMQFQLFLSRELRELRARIGEPDVLVAAFADDSLRVSLSTPLDVTYLAQFRWPLGPGDDFGAICRSILDLLAACRLDRVDVLPDVQPSAASH